MFKKHPLYKDGDNPYYKLAEALNIMGGVSGTISFYLIFFSRSLTDIFFLSFLALGFTFVFLSGAFRDYADSCDEEYRLYKIFQKAYIEESTKGHESLTPNLKPKEHTITPETHPNVVPLKQQKQWPAK